MLLDVMVNHISQQSHYFQDFLARGKDSPYGELFLTLDKIWPGGEPVQADVDKIFLRRGQPYSTFKIKATGEEIKVWTTFGKQDPSEQIDLDINSPKTKELLADILKNFSKHNVKLVRLDAVGYVVKNWGPAASLWSRRSTSSWIGLSPRAAPTGWRSFQRSTPTTLSSTP